MEKPSKRSLYAGMSALGEIKDSAIILSLGNEYLCLEPILIKIGRAVDRNVEEVREEIASLKKQFPGKYTPEINTENILTEIQETAQVLQQPNKELQKKCRTGELGRGLENKTKALAKAIDDIRLKIEGKRPSYSIIDAFFKPLQRLSGFRRPLGGILSWVFKVALAFLVFCMLAGVYRFLSMEREPELLKKIAASESAIESKQTVISDLDIKHNDIIRLVADIEKKKLLRQDKIAIIDLEMKLHEIGDEKQKVQAEIDLLRDSIQKKRKKIEDINEKTIWKRMLEPVLP